MIIRMMRAFVRALRLTLRGEPAPIAALRASQPAFSDWALRVIAACDAVDRAAHAARLSTDALIIHADGRDHTMTVILKGVRFHVSEEYPYMLRGGDRFAPLAVNASNLNDRFLVSRLRQHAPDALGVPLDTLSAALEALPSLNSG